MVVLAAAFGFTAAPAIAQQGGMSVQAPPPKPVRTPPGARHPHPLYPAPSWAHPDEVRCEQDRLLTDTTPCGAGTGQPEVIGRSSSDTIVAVPDRPKRCEQDRKITDDTPCTH